MDTTESLIEDVMCPEAKENMLYHTRLNLVWPKMVFSCKSLKNSNPHRDGFKAHHTPFIHALEHIYLYCIIYTITTRPFKESVRVDYILFYYIGHGQTKITGQLPLNLQVGLHRG